MKKQMILALALVALFATSALATPVTFSTAGTFTCGNVISVTCSLSGPGNSIVTIGTGLNTFSLNFNGLASSTVNPNPSTNTSFGFVHSSTTGTGNSVGTGEALGFKLTITQTNPGPTGTGTLLAVIIGQVSVDPNSASGDVHFLLSDIPANINGVSYAPQIDDFIVPPSTLNGDTTLQGVVSVPEPASLALLGSGLMFGGNFVRRKLAR
jgi:hypothetical protein